ncbi:Cytochrome bo(3) ubiquinol oxidase subunit 4 [Candidatus Hartigia pinicola]|nr:Cytochrome bo(3) ubiquinol oxidase subunit 4 [Candidatus Hartigia pinicola]
MRHIKDIYIKSSHGNIKTYIIGFILSVILTIIPFWIIMKNIASQDSVFWIVISLSVLQIFVHLICFLHINISSNEHWNFVALLFTILIISIIVIGSLWIMHNVNINMMLN